MTKLITIKMQLATEGRVQELSDVLKAKPSLIQSRDRRGANLLHHAARYNQTAIIDLIIGFPGGKDRKFSQCISAD